MLLSLTAPIPAVQTIHCSLMELLASLFAQLGCD
jgi:hypothetical protein